MKDIMDMVYDADGYIMDICSITEISPDTIIDIGEEQVYSLKLRLMIIIEKANESLRNIEFTQMGNKRGNYHRDRKGE